VKHVVNRSSWVPDVPNPPPPALEDSTLARRGREGGQAQQGLHESEDSTGSEARLARDFHFDLPPELIAQAPAPRRDESRLLVLHRPTERIDHRRFSDLTDYLDPGDLLVLNDSRVIPARLRGAKAGSGSRIEILLAEQNAPNDWWALLRPGKRVRAGTRLLVHPQPAPLHRAAPPEPLTAVVLDKDSEGLYRLQFTGPTDIATMLEVFGEVPLPPYIRRDASPGPEDRERYQTVYAAAPGSIAAPTAGLHFTPELLDRLRSRGIRVAAITLHVGLGTFAPVKTHRIDDHRLHQESFELPPATAQAVLATRAAGHRVVAVGTTTVRVLETAAAAASRSPVPSTPLLSPCRSKTDLFIRPPFPFRVVDALLTNFHLPESTLLMLVSAFARPGQTTGREIVLAAYRTAVSQRYRFFSYGDAMLLL